MPVLKVKKDGIWEELSGTSSIDNGNADTLDGKHASYFATASDMNDLQSKVGDTSVSEQISTAVANLATSDHSHDVATTSASGFMSAEDKAKLDSLTTDGSNITVDDVLSSTSTNPVQNQAVYAAIDTIESKFGFDTVALEVENALKNYSTTEQMNIAINAVKDEAVAQNVIYVGAEEPTESYVQLWIDPSDSLPNFEEVRF